VASLSQGRTAAAQCGLFTYKSVPVIFEPPCISFVWVTPYLTTNSNTTMTGIFKRTVPTTTTNTTKVSVSEQRRAVRFVFQDSGQVLQTTACFFAVNPSIRYLPISSNTTMY